MKLFGGLLKIKRSNTELVQLYSEALTQQFQEGLEHIKTQLKETLMPLLERNFKNSIHEIKEMFLKNIDEIGQQYEGERTNLLARQAKLKNLLNKMI